jgi:uncharacterized membrane protein YgcG
MKRSSILFITIISYNLLTLTPALANPIPIPERESNVTDLANMLRNSDREKLSQKLDLLENKTGVHMDLLTLKYSKEYFETNVIRADYAKKTARSWSKNTGDPNKYILLTIFHNDNAYKHRTEITANISVHGEKLANLLNPDVTEKIVNDTIVAYSKDDLKIGIEKGVDRIIVTIETGSLPPLSSQEKLILFWDSFGNLILNISLLLIVTGIVFLMIRIPILIYVIRIIGIPLILVVLYAFISPIIEIILTTFLPQIDWDLWINPFFFAKFTNVSRISREIYSLIGIYFILLYYMSWQLKKT